MTPPRLPTDRQPTGRDTPQRRSALMPELKTDADALAVTNEAGRRYYRDPEFSARVKLAAAVAERGQPDDGFDRFHRDSVIIGAAVALHLAEIEAAA